MSLNEICLSFCIAHPFFVAISQGTLNRISIGSLQQLLKTDYFETQINDFYERQVLMRKCRILSVDDNADNNEIIQEILCDDYEVKIASSGEEALQIAPEFKPDLILLDIMMPGIDGYETCKRIKSDTSFKDTIVIMVSAKEQVDDKVEGYEAGAFDYITKPFSEEDLINSIEFFLNKEANSAA